MASFLMQTQKYDYDTLLRHLARVMMRRIDEDVAEPIRCELRRLDWADAVTITENLMRMGGSVLKNSLWMVLLEEVQKIRDRKAVKVKYSSPENATGDSDVTTAALAAFAAIFSISNRYEHDIQMGLFLNVSETCGDDPALKQEAIARYNEIRDTIRKKYPVPLAMKKTIPGRNQAKDDLTPVQDILEAIR